MVKISIQFHADRGETLGWVTSWAQDMNLFLAVELFTPGSGAVLVDGSRTEEAMASSAESRLFLSLNAIDTGADSSWELIRQNPDVLVVSLGMQDDEVLRESAIAAMTEDARSLQAWRAVRRRAKASLHRRTVTLINTISPTHQVQQPHYYSTGAEDLARRGVRLLASAGWVEYRLP